MAKIKLLQKKEYKTQKIINAYIALVYYSKIFYNFFCIIQIIKFLLNNIALIIN